MVAYYFDERTLVEIGRMLCMRESTVSRRLEKITLTLRKRIVKELCKAGLSKKAAEEMLTVDIRDLGVDVRGRLAQGKRGQSF